MKAKRYSVVVCLIIYVLALQAGVAIAVPATESNSGALKLQVDAGRMLFATNCANCHGATGHGANGPALADRNLAQAMISDTILNGRVGTPMPPFKDELDAKSQDDIVAFVTWMTSGGSAPQSVVAHAQNSVTSSASNVASEVMAVGQDSGRPGAGALLFFDPTNLYSCHNCHSYSNKGGPVGPDLAGSHRTSLDIFHSLTHAEVQAAGFPAVMIELRSGSRIRGIKSGETSDAVVVFDLSSLPPVAHTFSKAEISNMTEIRGSGIYDHTKLPFTKQDRLDLSAFLGQPVSPSPSR